MKTNAIVRIVLYSLAIMILTGILVTGLGETSRSQSEFDDVIYTNSSSTPVSATVVTTASIYSVPHSSGEIIGTLGPGTEVTIMRQETVNGTPWALMSEGWVLMECLDAEVSSNVQVPTLGGSGVSVDAAGLRKISIGWVAGDITIRAMDGIDQIHISESPVEDEDDLMNITHKGDALTIQFTNDNHTFIGINLGKEFSKNLLIHVPADWICDELQIEVASATVTLDCMTIGEVDFDGASGTCDFQNCTVTDLDMDTASGDVSFYGELTRLDFDAASASFTGTFLNCPEEIEIDGMSGDLNLALPEKSGFTVTMDGLSSNFRSEFGYEQRNGAFVSGDGRCRIDVSGLSCDVYISKTSS